MSSVTLIPSRAAALSSSIFFVSYTDPQPDGLGNQNMKPSFFDVLYNPFYLPSLTAESNVEVLITSHPKARSFSREAFGVC